MKVFNLRCEHGHAFEGWFGSEDDVLGQQARGLLHCPLCDTAAVQRMPSAPRLNLKAARGEAVPAVAPDPAPAVPAAVVPTTSEQAAARVEVLHAAYLQAVQHVLDHTEDVGSGFAEEARRIHYGEAQERGIRGQTTPDQVQELNDEGISVGAFVLPAALTGTKH